MNDIYICISQTSPQWQNTALFHETALLAKISAYNDRLIEEAAEIKLHLNNKNRDKGFKLSKAWNHSTNLLRHSNTHTS
jgi:hypothetical protein